MSGTLSNDSRGATAPLSTQSVWFMQAPRHNCRSATSPMRESAQNVTADRATGTIGEARPIDHRITRRGASRKGSRANRLGDTGRVEALEVRRAGEHDFEEWLAVFEEVAAEG